MDFAFSTEQHELRRSLRQLAEKHATSVQVRAAAEVAAPCDYPLWAKLGALGVPGLAIPESQGGAGASWVELGIALEEAGRALMPVPLLSTACASSALAAGPDIGLLSGLAGGSLIGALALTDGGPVPLMATETVQGWRLHGSKHFVLDGGVADVLVVTARTVDGEALFAVRPDAEGVALEAIQALDVTRGQASVHLVGSQACHLGDAAAARRARDLWALALALESVGAARRCLEFTIEHLKTRVQFGRPIGSFQALKHRVADLAVELEAATAAVYYAAWAAGASPEELSIVAPVAALTASAAFGHVTAEAIQLHGGMGFTWEHDAHLYYKRAKTTELLLGGPSALRQQVFERAGLGRG